MKFTRELESSDSDSKTHFGTHMIKPNFCQHNVGRYILNKMLIVLFAYIITNNDSVLLRTSKMFASVTVDLQNCSSRNRHENAFLNQNEKT